MSFYQKFGKKKIYFKLFFLRLLKTLLHFILVHFASFFNLVKLNVFYPFKDHKTLDFVQS